MTDYPYIEHALTPAEAREIGRKYDASMVHLGEQTDDVWEAFYAGQRERYAAPDLD